ncbi:E3 ubiquitin-protein ligase AMFR-like [Lineus longissimus]|uniref:E3 ubiquitin-protein ligase AMFR-like n=1 Tax=Lineus longissimus TaxID=88925 RepID=UPI002B4EFDBC
MPVVLLERLPLPSLQTYTTFSVGLLICAVFFAHQAVFENYEQAQNITDTGQDPDTHNDSAVNIFQKWDHYLFDVFQILIQETWCVWTLINMAYCGLILVGKTIQNMVFGELRVSEQQHIRDKFWNFVFYKFIFIFGVMNVQNMDEVVMWCGWFSVLGFLHLLTQLCKDRFEYLSFSPTTPKWTHIRVLALLAVILLSCSFLILVCTYVGLQTGFNTFAFMVAECILLIISTTYVITRYGTHLWEISLEGTWENRGFYIYYTELVFELAALLTDFAHHLHMLIWGNIFLSMASLVICMQLRYLFYEFQRRIKRHKNYLRVVNSMEKRFSMATAEDLEADDDCAICWDKMEQARKLPCGHIFHYSCLRSWLEQDTTCPTCRTSLSDPLEEETAGPTERGAGDADTGQPDGTVNANGNANQTSNHFFHFDGSRYISWFPSFSVEVTHTRLLANQQRQPVPTNQNSHFDHMARQVQGVFPNMPLSVLEEDLRVSNSVEQTIENILEGRVIAPPTSAFTTLTTDRPVYEDSSSNEGNEEDSESTHSDESTSRNSDRSHLIMNNFYEDDNIPDLSKSEETVNECDEPMQGSGSGFRFSKSPKERENMLQKRKEEMLEVAKKKYMMANKELTCFSSDEVENSDSESDCDNTNVSRGSRSPILNQRELAYRAAQQRLLARRDDE